MGKKSLEFSPIPFHIPPFSFFLLSGFSFMTEQIRCGNSIRKRRRTQIEPDTSTDASSGMEMVVDRKSRDPSSGSNEKKRILSPAPVPAPDPDPVEILLRSFISIPDLAKIIISYYEWPVHHVAFLPFHDAHMQMAPIGAINIKSQMPPVYLRFMHEHTLCIHARCEILINANPLPILSAKLVWVDQHIDVTVTQRGTTVESLGVPSYEWHCPWWQDVFQAHGVIPRYGVELPLYFMPRIMSSYHLNVLSGDCMGRIVDVKAQRICMNIQRPSSAPAQKNKAWSPYLIQDITIAAGWTWVLTSEMEVGVVDPSYSFQEYRLTLSKDQEEKDQVICQNFIPLWSYRDHEEMGLPRRRPICFCLRPDSTRLFVMVEFSLQDSDQEPHKMYGIDVMDISLLVIQRLVSRTASRSVASSGVTEEK